VVTGIVSGGAQLVDREQELAGISSALEAAGAGNGRVLIVEGSAGIGKTELLRIARSSAARSGFTALCAAGAEVERELPYGVVRQLFERFLVRAPAEERAELLSGAAAGAAIVLDQQPTSGVLAFETPEPVAGCDSAPTLAATIADRSFRVDHALYWLCANMAARAPVLLAVDDAHWIDAASSRFLRYLARRIEELPIVLIISARSEEGGSPSLDELRNLPMAVILRPRPLSKAAVACLTRAVLGDRAEEAFCTACHEATRGNPFLLQEVLRTLVDQGAEPVAASASRIADMGPSAVSRAILSRIDRISPGTPDLARAVAVLGPDTPLRHAAALACLSLAQAGIAADRLAAAEILRPGRPLGFVHPVVRAAVYEALRPAARFDAHRRAAQILAEDGAPPDRVAAHLLACEPAGDPWVVTVLQQAAQHALNSGAPDSAVRYLRRALDEPPLQAARTRVLHDLGAAELRWDGSMAVDHLRAAIRSSQQPEDRARICFPLLQALLWTDRVGEAVDIVSDTIEAVQGHDRELALRLEAELVTALRTGVAMSPLADQRLARWQTGVEGRTPAERVLLVHLAVRTALRGADADTVAGMAQRALGEGRLLTEQTPESIFPFLALYQLMCADRRLDLVDHCLDVAFARARQRGSLFGFAYASIFRSYLSWVKGALADAEADALQGVDVAARVPGWGLTVAVALDALVTVFLERGKTREAEAALTEHGLAGELADSVPARLLLASRGHLRLAQGRTREGLADLMELIAREDRTGPANLFLTSHRSLAALGLARQGEVDRAIALADDAVARARAWGAAPGLGTALRHAGLVHGGGDGLELLAEAAEVLEGSPSAVVAHAWALTDLGAALRRVGRRSEAVDRLRRGMDVAHQCGADPLAARARQELVAAGARPRRRAVTGVESLTASERRTCQLAVQGMTNREIAQALFVTLRTVEVHLTHAYQKLQIGSREDLPRSLLHPGPECP